ncbi:MAG: hypothetical protein Pg6C_01910 [Treponemataceae bacterium]|nr:MAG: hypothetical protein Pg6C_01910 [Treponemataceae bacterium]
MKNQLFETIYNGCNSIAENAYLESPLDTELKPPMLMEDIYFECNVRPLFEQVLREMAVSDYRYFGIFKSDILQNPATGAKSVFVSADFEEIIRKYDSNQQFITCVILPCSDKGAILSQNPNELQKMMLDLAMAKEKTYETTLQHIRNYRKVLSERGLLKLTQKLNTDVANQRINNQRAIQARNDADPKNK